MSTYTTATATVDPEGTLHAAPGHQHDETCEITSDWHRHNRFCYLAEAVWQAYGAGSFTSALGSVAVALEHMADGQRKPDADLALRWLREAAEQDNAPVARGPGADEALADVTAALERLASEQVEEPGPAEVV